MNVKKSYDALELIQLALGRTQCAAHSTKHVGSMKASNFLDSSDTINFKEGLVVTPKK